MAETTTVIIPGGCLQNTKISLKCKAPDERIKYTFSLANQLASDEQIVSVQEQIPYGSGLKVSDYSYNIKLFSCNISGGKILHNVPIKFIISTQKNTIYSFVCVLPIRQQGTLIENSCGMNGILDQATPMGTVAVGTTTTLDAGEKATVDNIGIASAAVLNFAIPKGDPGTAATVTVGNVTKGDAGSDPLVTNSGSSNSAILDFVLPTGADGETPTVQIGETQTLPAGHDATVKATTVNNVVTLFFGIPSGTTGEAGQYILNIGTVTTLPPGQDATAEIISDGQGTHSLNLSIPKGEVGDKGEKGDTGATGAQGPQGEKGDTGATGAQGDYTTVTVGTTTVGEAGTEAKVSGSSDGKNLTLDFTFPTTNYTQYKFLTGKKIAYFGDSITAYKGESVGSSSYPFSDVTSYAVTWESILANKTGGTIGINNSYGGSCISNPEWLTSNTSLLTRISTLPTDTDICITLMGVNDFRNNIGLGTIDYTKTSWSVGYFGDAVCKAMIDMNTQSPKTRFVWVGILGDFTGGYKTTQNKNSGGLTVSQYNEVIKNCCKQYGNIYIDPIETFSYLSQNCFADGLHPNAFGMTRLANMVLNKITNII